MTLPAVTQRQTKTQELKKQPSPPFKSCRFGKICRTGQPFQCLQYCLYLHHGPSSSVFKVTFDGKGDGLTTSFTWNGTPVGENRIQDFSPIFCQKFKLFLNIRNQLVVDSWEPHPLLNLHSIRHAF